MPTMQYTKKEAIIICPECKTSFKANIGSEKNPWQHFMFKCPVCNEMRCVARNEIIK